MLMSMPFAELPMLDGYSGLAEVTVCRVSGKGEVVTVSGGLLNDVGSDSSELGLKEFLPPSMNHQRPMTEQAVE
jgi:hypothetical protein